MKNWILLTLGCTLLFESHVYSQRRYGTGLIFDQNAYEKTPILPDLGEKGFLLDTISYRDLTPYTPIAQDQGEYPTCTGWAVGFNAYTTQRAILNQWKNQRDLITQNAYSVFYLYNQIKESEACTEGTRINDALEFLVKQGNIMANDFDFRLDPCTLEPTEAQKQLGAQHRIKEYRKLFELLDPPLSKVKAVKRSLAYQQPVVVCMQITDSFYNLFREQNGIKYKIWSPVQELSLGYHAMVVVGFDEGYPRPNGGFKLMNSWGTDWGDEGFIWIKYEDFAQNCCGAYHFSIDKPIEEAQEFKAEIDLRIPYWNEGLKAFQFDYLKPARKDDIYTVNNLIWRVGSKYQLIIKNVQYELFFYALSVDSERNVQTHWPRNHESAIIHSPSLELTIPSEEKVLVLEKQGLEEIMLLFSATPLENFSSDVERLGSLLADSNEQLSSLIKQIWGDKILKKEEVLFSSDQIKFSSAAFETGIVPISINMTVEPAQN